LTKSTIRNVAKITLKRWKTGHDRYVKLFAESLLNGTDPPVTVEDGLEVTKTLEKMCGMIERAEPKQKTVSLRT
jgi:predicted dehydrogenase